MQPAQIPGVPQITEDDLVSSGPGVRFLLVQRYERLWEPIDRTLEESKAMGIPPDPRLVELGIRINKELSLLYRLQKPPVHVIDDDDGLGSDLERVDMIEAELAQVEAKLREAPPGRL